MSEPVEVKKPVLPVTGLFGELGAGGDLTAVQVLNSLLTSDSSLALKTEIVDVPAFSVLGVLSGVAESNCLTETAKTLNRFIREYRENMVSFKRQGRKEIVQGIIADLERSKREGEGVGERLVGSRATR